MVTSNQFQLVQSQVTQWASSHAAIMAAALVGSWARGEARPDSDVDFIFLTKDPSQFRANTTWMLDALGGQFAGEPMDWRDEDYGVVWSRHLMFGDKVRIEFSFAHLDWAQADPIDPGTCKVVQNGFNVLVDKGGYFELLEALSSEHRQ